MEETERVKLILTAKTPREYIDDVKNAQLVKKMLHTFYVTSLIISIARYTITFKYPEIQAQINTTFIIVTVIDLTINLIAQTIVLSVFYINFRFFRDQHILSAGHQRMPLKLKLLTCWIIILFLQNIIDLIFRIFIRILSAYGNEVLN